MRPAYILDAVRTPVGKLGGALASARPDDLAAATLKALTDRTTIDPAELDDIFLGNANGAGEENRDVARMAALLGEATEILATGHGITREAQDLFALESHEKAAKAWAAGTFDAELVPWDDLGIDGPPLTRDESIRDGGTPEVMAKLKPAFRPDGTVTAGNASTLNDGAPAVLIASEPTANRLQRTPMARIVVATLCIGVGQGLAMVIEA